MQTAWRDQRNEDVAATIVGYIRQAALGSPLVPYGGRVDRAVARMRRGHKFTDPQNKWLDRIAKQVKLETVVDPRLARRGAVRGRRRVRAAEQGVRWAAREPAGGAGGGGLEGRGVNDGERCAPLLAP